ncbi:MAG: right-handed parallel beta-helix repeat-containing protein [Nitrospirae bacterium]|nr:right-handed parallel beta-helix repeat-containing protein [Nitrospirota bacterium]
MRYGYKLKLSVLFLIYVFCFPGLSSAAVIEGIVLSENGPLEDPQVFAYDTFKDYVSGKPPHVFAKGDKKGFFRMKLPPGRYYFISTGESSGTKYFSYHGANPVEITGRDLWVPFMALPRTGEISNGPSGVGLYGKITFKGAPVHGAQVSIYPVADKIFRGMGFLTSTSDDQGLFRMSPEPGEYVIVARKRKDFNGLRPLRKGDLFCFYDGNPVSVAESGVKPIEISCYPKDDLVAFLDEQTYPSVLVKKSGKGSLRFRDNKIERMSEELSIKGRVTDLNGNPMPDLYVSAYKGRPDQMFQMLYVRTMPEHIAKTDKDGHYEINTAGSGSYYMVARELIGEAPAKGENYGLYEDNANHSVTVEKGPIDNVNIIVSKVMAEKSKGQGAGGKGQGTEVRNYLYDGDTVINRDTVWSGYIVIKGTVHVARNATLTISPGTVIMFRKTDRDHDGVGDSMITVSGRLIAEGSPGSVIRFTSAEDRPGKMDWSYLLFFVSGEESIVKYCVFEYAFTGVQAHFSTAVITDSIFKGNHEGIRFGRAELRIEHNDIYGNAYGIRHTRLEGPVEIAHNDIKNNDVGVFLVPSNQNIVDFSRTFDKAGSLNQYQPVVTRNNISYNVLYNYRLGERQGYDIQMRDNWWGSIREAVIRSAIYDGRMDRTLGNVIYKPFLNSPAEKAGVRNGG